MDLINEDIIKGYLEVQQDKLLGMEANALRVLCEDYLTRARREREMAEKIKDWQNDTPTIFIDRNAPPVIQHYSHNVPMHAVAKLLMELSDKLKEEIDVHCDMMFKEQRDDLKQVVSNACANFDKHIRSHIIK